VAEKTIFYIEPAGQKAHALKSTSAWHTRCGQFIPHGPRMRTTVRPPEHRLCKRCALDTPQNKEGR
jgi:hypothetical protein